MSLSVFSCFASTRTTRIDVLTGGRELPSSTRPASTAEPVPDTAEVLVRGSGPGGNLGGGSWPPCGGGGGGGSDFLNSEQPGSPAPSTQYASMNRIGATRCTLRSSPRR